MVNLYPMMMVLEMPKNSSFSVVQYLRYKNRSFREVQEKIKTRSIFHDTMANQSQKYPYRFDSSQKL